MYMNNTLPNIHCMNVSGRCIRMMKITKAKGYRNLSLVIAPHTVLHTLDAVIF
jgi:hypothetical protein